jgi:hypothetical protein
VTKKDTEGILFTSQERGNKSKGDSYSADKTVSSVERVVSVMRLWPTHVVLSVQC